MDFDPVKGLAVYDSVDQSVFSGVYKIITVENEFSRGQFTQSLNLIRLFDQPGYDTIEGIEQQQNNRSSQPTTPKEVKDKEAAKSEEKDEFGDLDGAIARQQQANAAEVDEFGDYDGAVERQRVANDAEADPWGNFDTSVADAQKRLRDDLATAEVVNTGNVTDLGLG